MEVRKLYRIGNSRTVAIPVDILKKREWANVRYVYMEYHPPFIVMRPLTLDELMQFPKSEDEELPARALSHAKP